MKKCVSCFLAIFLLLSLGSCDAPKNDSSVNADQNEYYCYSYASGASDKVRGEKKIHGGQLKAAYRDWQEKSEYVLPETRTANFFGKEYLLTLSRDSMNEVGVYYQIQNENGMLEMSFATDYYGHELLSMISHGSDAFLADANVSEVYGIDALKEIASNAAAEYWDGVYDISKAEVRIYCNGEVGDWTYYRVEFKIIKNGYIAAIPSVTVDQYGNVWLYTSNLIWEGSYKLPCAEQYPDFDTEKMRAAADRYVQKWFPAPEEQKEEDTVTVRLVNFFNGQYGLLFEYKRQNSFVQVFRVIVTPEEYANAIPIEQ